MRMQSGKLGKNLTLRIAKPYAGMFLALIAGSITSLISAQGAKPNAEVPARVVSLDYPFGMAGRWLSHVKSFHLRAELRDERSPDGIAKGLRQLKGEFPDLKDPDPLVFNELLPTIHGSAAYAFDQTRLRSFSDSRADKNRELSRELRFWDG